MGDLIRRPKLLGISVVKNEQDIIEPFVRHNLRFLDRLMVIDNGSADDTKEILEQLQRELPALVLVHDDEFGHTQSLRMNHLLRTGRSAYHPDYVVPLDADEFVGASSRREFCEVLETIPRGGCGILPWQTFVLTPETLDVCGIDPPGSFRWRRRHESPAFCKAILRTDSEQADDLRIDFGNHEVKSAFGREVPHVSLSPLKLLHFPVRSREQFLARIVIGWMANLARDANVRANGLGWQKRDNFDRITRGDAIDDRTLCEISLLYAQYDRPLDWQADTVAEVPPIEYIRRYSNGQAMNAIQSIARTWEQTVLVKYRSEMAAD